MSFDDLSARASTVREPTAVAPAPSRRPLAWAGLASVAVVAVLAVATLLGQQAESAVGLEPTMRPALLVKAASEAAQPAPPDVSLTASANDLAPAGAAPNWSASRRPEPAPLDVDAPPASGALQAGGLVSDEVHAQGGLLPDDQGEQPARVAGHRSPDDASLGGQPSERGSESAKLDDVVAGDGVKKTAAPTKGARRSKPASRPTTRPVAKPTSKPSSLPPKPKPILDGALVDPFAS